MHKLPSNSLSCSLALGFGSGTSPWLQSYSSGLLFISLLQSFLLLPLKSWISRQLALCKFFWWIKIWVLCILQIAWWMHLNLSGRITGMERSCMFEQLLFPPSFSSTFFKQHDRLGSAICFCNREVSIWSRERKLHSMKFRHKLQPETKLFKWQ